MHQPPPRPPHIIDPRILARAKLLADQHRQDEAFRAFVVRNFLWTGPLIIACVIISIATAIAGMVGLGFLVTILLGNAATTQNALTISFSPAPLLIAAGLFCGVFYWTSKGLFGWLETRMLRQQNLQQATMATKPYPGLGFENSR